MDFDDLAGRQLSYPEVGEEFFAVRHDPDTDRVFAEVVAFSRHGPWWIRLGAPVASAAQRLITDRYLAALRET
ncbi:DUF1990 family protein [Mycolicibacterium brumae]|uniref:DUF1990 domain-containing protein n=1 Tax=Mycolicibacterium brumae TaxID=85968 RepID=A0A2G5P672_9MYCO|nr:DUF1990 family protein [Mycolicibacterium brumae]PIB73523.1 DUF1990 domain-containing protein [Mycolicibacterium brumae]RWA20464.1 hypothetical protein MBRU_02070 [Mycolicibacterium brumae DSM 44177]